jgi:two-component system, NarL family, response regulator NreC
MSKKIKLAVVDDVELIRKGLADLFLDNEKVEIIGKYKDSNSFLESVTEIKPDVVLMDISLKNGKSGLIVAKDLLNIFPDINIIMLTIHLSSNYIFESIKIGARGYFTKLSEGFELVQAVENISYDKEFYMSSDVKNLINKEFLRSIRDKDKYLTDIEREIINFISEGKNLKEIAIEMELSPKTIANYKTTILNKLDSKNDIEMVTRAIREKIISGE